MAEAARIVIPFTGPGAGTVGLSWGQQQIWKAMRETNSSMGMGAVVPAPPGHTVDDYAAELRFFLTRYQAMRTLLRFGPDGTVTQRVHDSGESGLDVIDVDDGEDPAEAGEARLAHWREHNYAYESEWPMRMAVIRHRGIVTHVVVMLCHLYADGVSVGVMMRELAERDPATGLHPAPPAGTQPLDLVAWQASPAARRHTDNAMRYWAAQLRAIPATRFAPSAEPGEPRYWQVCWNSPAAYLAMRAIGARTAVESGPILLAAYAGALARVTGDSTVVTQTIVNNRFRPGLADAVTPLNQNGLCVVDTADAGFADLVDRAARASIVSSKHAYYDPQPREDLIAQISAERGEPIDLASFYNDRRTLTPPDEPIAGPDRILAARTATELLWERPMKTFNEKLMVNIDEVPGTLQLTVEQDTRYVSHRMLRAFLAEFENTLVDAATMPS